MGKANERRSRRDRWKARSLVGKVQERYGIAKEEAERQVAEFERTKTM